MIINYGKKMLDITSGCKSLFGNIEPEEMADEVIFCLFVSHFYTYISLCLLGKRVTGKWVTF
jgi:hypothetical protein